MSRGPRQVLGYLADEVPDGETLTWSDLTFVRTAQVEQTAYWIWRFNEPTGDAAYATVAVGPDGTQTIGYGDEADCYGLSPEQYSRVRSRVKRCVAALADS